MSDGMDGLDGLSYTTVTPRASLQSDAKNILGNLYDFFWTDVKTTF